jgi:hypothetical protein
MLLGKAEIFLTNRALKVVFENYFLWSEFFKQLQIVFSSCQDTAPPTNTHTMLGIQPRALRVQMKHSTTYLYPQPRILISVGKDMISEGSKFSKQRLLKKSEKFSTYSCSLNDRSKRERCRAQVLVIHPSQSFAEANASKPFLNCYSLINVSLR